MFKRLLLINVVLPLCSFAQGQQTIYQILAHSITSAPSHPLLVTNNIGESFHSFAIIEGTTGTNTCLSTLGSSFTASIEGSYDGLNFFAIPQVKIGVDLTDTDNKTSTKIYRAAGAYPYVRIRVIDFPTVVSPCSITIAYTGSLNSTTLNDTTSPNATYQSVTLSSSCTTVVIPVTGGPNNQTGITGIVYTGEITATSTLTLYADNGVCSDTIGTYNISTGSLNILPDLYNSPLMIFNSTQGVSAKLTGSTTGTVTLYRSQIN